MRLRFDISAGILALLLASAQASTPNPQLLESTLNSSSAADLFLTGSIPRLQLELEPNAIESLTRLPRKYVAARLTEGSTVYPQVGVHLKGSVGSFRTIDDKPSFTLDFCRFNQGKRFHGLRKIHLNNSVEDPSFANEKLGSELFRAAGVPAPRTTRALVKLNGRTLGIYVLKEGFTEDFLALHFRDLGGDLYEPGDGHDVNEDLDRNSVAAPVDQGRGALKRVASAALTADPVRRWRDLESALDTREFLAFMSMEIMLGHRDGYCLARNNFRVYHDLDSGKVLFFPHGMDQLFGTADLPWQPALAGTVAVAVMGTAEGRQGYAETFGSLLTNVFRAEVLTNRVDELAQELRPVLSRGEWAKIREASGAVKERIAQREASLVAQLKQPRTRPLALTGGVGHPQGWEIAASPQQGRMGHAELEGRTALHIATTAQTTASWHTTVLLAAGRYRFQGEVRIAGVEPLSHGVYQGAGLRIGGGFRKQPAFTGTSTWRRVATDFEVSQPMEEVELICELRARAGEVWFDAASLCLVKIDDL